MKVRNKYHAIRCTSDGIKFPSKKERDYYLSLKEAQEEDRLAFFLRQTPFHLPGNVKYVIDFIEFWRTEDPNVTEVKFTDVKGILTPVYKIKKKLIEATFPIKINEVH